MYLKIETKIELVNLVNFIENISINWLAIDTEFSRETTYYPVLSLIQIATLDQVWVIDVIQCKDITPLQLILENKKIKKIFHAGEQDWAILKQYTEARTWPFTDTQLMAAFAKLEHSASLEKLVLEFLGITIDKSQQKTDWLTRPLMDEQLIYAAQDAQYVTRIYPLLEQKVKDLERSSWVDEEMHSLLQKYENVNFDKNWLKLCTNGNIQWPTPYYAYQLAKWREDLAKKLDMPRRHVVSDSTLERILQKKSINQVDNSKYLPEIYNDLKTFWHNLNKEDTNSIAQRKIIEQMVIEHHKIFTREHLKQIKAWHVQAKKLLKS